MRAGARSGGVFHPLTFKKTLYFYDDSHDVRIALADTGDLNLYEANGTPVLTVDSANDNVGIGTTNPGAAYKLHVVGDGYYSGEVWATDYNYHSRYPADLATAYAAVESICRLPDEEYDPDDDHKQLDHAKLHRFVKAEVPGTGELGLRIGSAVAAQNEVIKDLIERIQMLEDQVVLLDARCP